MVTFNQLLELMAQMEKVWCAASEVIKRSPGGLGLLKRVPFYSLGMEAEED